VLSAFFAEAQTESWWNDTLTDLHDNYGLNVAFVPTFLDAFSNMDAFAPISYGFGNWGGRNYVNTDPNFNFPGTQVSLVDQAHALGKIWMQPVAFQDERPYTGTYEESGNTLTNSNDWQIATDHAAEWVQLVTWNDYAENTDMAPSADQGYRLLDMQAYNIADFKYGSDPTVLRDALYVSNRTQFANAESTYDETMPMVLAPGTPAATDTVDVVVFATAPATVVADIGGVVSTCGVGAGRSVCSFPLQTGDITVGLQRDGVWTTIVQSPYSVTATPFVQNEEYHVAGGLR
jgi:Glycosyl hydrolase family 71